ncbi:GPO family capsid scaffolding protein [Ottowia sp. SB7-C50]|uniref:GPO family capsid scaffolding protein n=1 Tax=Ottowia sp. SB7-C50 TaxID=3081231 RepID=UPI00295535C8|nr:GPO family capsid scaffolding protein [Ottowia sp. SB7-C50]WOP14650.1 GPO family capsid scaffolding protein [Ottowia sp. SB7-C50]
MKKSIFTALAFAITLAIGFGTAAMAGHPVPGDLLGAALSPDALHGLGLAGALPLAIGKTKAFRVATEGATTDGRRIERNWIEQMAKNFDPKKYGARVWLEHFRGIFPDGPFRAYGDVTAVEARTVEDGKLALFAQIDPSPDLVKIVNDQKQKVYTSIEVNPKFADSGEAYLVGLAVTDSPASLGTEMLQFAQQHPNANPLTKRKQDTGNLFTEAVETAIELEADDTTGADAQAFSDRIKGIVAKAFGRQKAGADQRFTDIAQGLDELATAITEQSTNQAAAFAELQDAHDQLATDFATLKKAHDDLLAQLDRMPAQQHTQRPTAHGGAGNVLTDC